MEMTANIDADLLVLDISGDITFFNVAQLVAEIDLARAMQGVCRVAINAERVPMIDSAAFGALVGKARQLMEDDGYLRLINPHPGIVNALHRIRIESILPTYNTLEEAIRPR
jgi:anti-anti-sigma factor